MNNLEKVEPVPLLLDELPDLITSEDPHDHSGAALSAKYLAEYAPQAPGVANLVAGTSNLEMLSQFPPGTAPKILERMAENFLQKSARGLALIALAQYRSSVSESFQDSYITGPLEESRRYFGPFGRLVTTQGMMRTYYDNILRKKEPSEHELLVARAMRLYVKGHTLSPILMIDNIFDARREKKHFKKLDAVS